MPRMVAVTHPILVGMNGLPEEVMAWFREQGARGGKTAAERMTPEARRSRSIAGNSARWPKFKQKIDSLHNRSGVAANLLQVNGGAAGYAGQSVPGAKPGKGEGAWKSSGEPQTGSQKCTSSEVLKGEGGMPSPVRYEGLVSVKDAAVLASTDIGTIWDWINAGKVRAFGHRQTTRVLLQDVLPPVIPKGSNLKRRIDRLIRLRSNRRTK